MYDIVMLGRMQSFMTEFANLSVFIVLLWGHSIHEFKQTISYLFKISQRVSPFIVCITHVLDSMEPNYLCLKVGEC